MTQDRKNEPRVAESTGEVNLFEALDHLFGQPIAIAPGIEMYLGGRPDSCVTPHGWSAQQGEGSVTCFCSDLLEEHRPCAMCKAAIVRAELEREKDGGA